MSMGRAGAGHGAYSGFNPLIVRTSMQFNDLGIDPSLLRVLETLGIETPTPVQREAIPVALAGRDLVAVAQTGTGRPGVCAAGADAVFGRSAGAEPDAGAGATRELAQQVHGVFEESAGRWAFAAPRCTAGVGYESQVAALKRGVSVGWRLPGVCWITCRGWRPFQRTDDSGAGRGGPDARHGVSAGHPSIIRKLPETRQTLMCSATFPRRLRGFPGVSD